MSRRDKKQETRNKGQGTRSKEQGVMNLKKDSCSNDLNLDEIIFAGSIS